MLTKLRIKKLEKYKKENKPLKTKIFIWKNRKTEYNGQFLTRKELYKKYPNIEKEYNLVFISVVGDEY